MAIKYITEMHGSASRSDGEISITRNLKYQLGTGDDPRDIIFDSHIPPDGSEHPTKTGYYVSGVSEPRRDSGNYDGSYIVAINYQLSSKIPADTKNKDATLPPWQQGVIEMSYDSIYVVVPLAFLNVFFVALILVITTVVGGKTVPAIEIDWLLVVNLYLRIHSYLKVLRANLILIKT